jgi:hypothetical protein
MKIHYMMWGSKKHDQVGSQARTQGQRLGQIPFNDITNMQ